MPSTEARFSLESPLLLSCGYGFSIRSIQSLPHARLLPLLLTFIFKDAETAKANNKTNFKIQELSSNALTFDRHFKFFKYWGSKQRDRDPFNLAPIPWPLPPSGIFIIHLLDINQESIVLHLQGTSKIRILLK